MTRGRFLCDKHQNASLLRITIHRRGCPVTPECAPDCYPKTGVACALCGALSWQLKIDCSDPASKGGHIARTGARVRRLRLAMGISTVELARMADVHAGQVSLIERMDSTAALWACERILAALLKLQAQQQAPPQPMWAVETPAPAPPSLADEKTCPECGAPRKRVIVHGYGCRADASCACAEWHWVCPACIETKWRERPPEDRTRRQVLYPIFARKAMQRKARGSVEVGS